MIHDEMNFISVTVSANSFPESEKSMQVVYFLGPFHSECIRPWLWENNAIKKQLSGACNLRKLSLFPEPMKYSKAVIYEDIFY